jgi:hypothetical protein
MRAIMRMASPQWGHIMGSTSYKYLALLEIRELSPSTTLTLEGQELVLLGDSDNNEEH